MKSAHRGTYAIASSDRIYKITEIVNITEWKRKGKGECYTCISGKIGETITGTFDFTRKKWTFSVKNTDSENLISRSGSNRIGLSFTDSVTGTEWSIISTTLETGLVVKTRLALPK